MTAMLISSPSLGHRQKDSCQLINPELTNGVAGWLVGSFGSLELKRRLPDWKYGVLTIVYCISLRKHCATKTTMTGSSTVGREKNMRRCPRPHPSSGEI